MLSRRGIGTAGVVEAPGRTTTEKVRIIARSQQVVRADFEDGRPVSGAGLRRASTSGGGARGHGDALVVSDYGKGVVVENRLASAVSRVAPPRQAGARRSARGALRVVPRRHRHHAQRARGPRGGGIDYRRGNDPAPVAFDLVRRLALDALLVTRGEDGMSLYYRDEPRQIHIPTVAKEVFDVTGAGDTVIGVLAAALGTGVEMVDAVVMAEPGGRRSDQGSGHVHPVAAELVAAFDDGPVGTGRPAPLIPRGELAEVARAWRAAGSAIVFTNGCFDLLHPGHLALLEASAVEGDVLLVAINDDASVTRLKGAGRPVYPAAERAETAARAALGGRGHGVRGGHAAARRSSGCDPHVLVKGAEYGAGAIVGEDLLPPTAGAWCACPMQPGYSTTGIVRRDDRSDAAVRET